MIDLKVAHDKIAGFQSADEIADFLRSEGVKGDTGLAGSCAIAVWMQVVTGETVYVSVDYTWQDDGFSDTNEWNPIDHTGAMIEFVDKFDTGEYPDLIIRHPMEWHENC